MAGSFSREALSRRMRHLGNKSSIPSGHPQGNKGSFAGGGPMGRAAGRQLASAKSNKNPFQRGAPSAGNPKPSGDPVSVTHANAPTPNSGIMNDMKLDKQRLKTPNPMATAASLKLGF